MNPSDPFGGGAVSHCISNLLGSLTRLGWNCKGTGSQCIEEELGAQVTNLHSCGPASVCF